MDSDIYTALIKSESKYRELVENANSIILRWSQDGLITYFNEFAQKFFGFTEEEIIGKHVMDTIVPKSESTGRDLRPLMEDICANPKSHESNINENITKNGDRVWVAWTNKVLTDDDGNIIGALSIGADITKQYQLEEELRHAHKMEAIGQLAGGVAHDFNNMLQGILGYAQMLKSKADDERQERLSQNIIDITKNAADLVKQLLTFSRQDKLTISKVDVHGIINDVTSMLSHTVDKKISIEKELNANLSNVMGDASLLKNAFLNLALNAKDAMPNGGVLKFTSKVKTINKKNRINSNLKLNEGDFLHIKVSDNGLGMDNVTRSKIFDPFFTTKEVGQGTGLGLSTVYGTIINHDGAIICKSSPNNGCCFDIYLPLSSQNENNSNIVKNILAKDTI